MIPNERIDLLIRELKHKNGVRRRRARLELERIGFKATPYLMQALKSKDYNIRWEAAKTLETIKDPLAALSLMTLLHDDVYEIRYLAASALIGLGRRVVYPLTKALQAEPRSNRLRQGAHHILKVLKEKDNLPPEAEDILSALWSKDADRLIPLVTEKAIMFHKKMEHSKLSGGQNGNVHVPFV